MIKITKEIKKFGGASHLILPTKYIGRTCTVYIQETEEDSAQELITKREVTDLIQNAVELLGGYKDNGVEDAKEHKEDSVVGEQPTAEEPRTDC